MTSRDAVLARYRGYLDACNERRWDELTTFVADEVVANGVVRNRREYVADIAAVIAASPEYRWKLERAVVEGEWLAVHLTVSTTRLRRTPSGPAGAQLTTDEFVMYRMVDGRVVHMEGAADNARLF